MSFRSFDKSSRPVMQQGDCSWAPGCFWTIHEFERKDLQGSRSPGTYWTDVSGLGSGFKAQGSDPWGRRRTRPDCWPQRSSPDAMKWSIITCDSVLLRSKPY